jgi:hypothetical protein
MKKTIIETNKFFAEKTFFGKKPHKLYYSEKLKLNYIIMLDTREFIFEDGVTYSGDEVLLIQENKDTNMIDAIHALKKEFNGSYIIK